MTYTCGAFVFAYSHGNALRVVCLRYAAVVAVASASASSFTSASAQKVRKRNRHPRQLYAAEVRIDIICARAKNRRPNAYAGFGVSSDVGGLRPAEHVSAIPFAPFLVVRRGCILLAFDAQLLQQLASSLPKSPKITKEQVLSTS